MFRTTITHLVYTQKNYPISGIKENIMPNISIDSVQFVSGGTKARGFLFIDQVNMI